MQTNFSNALGWSITALCFVLLSVNGAAKDKNPNTIVQGTVFLIDKATSTIMVDTKAGVRRVVVYSHDTTFRYGRGDKGQESAIDQLQEYEYISCRGTPDAVERLLAKECWHGKRR